VRAVIVSHLYADPANRAKLRALAGLGVTLAVAVPDRWASSTGDVRNTTPEDDGGIRVVPVSVRGAVTDPARLIWNGRALRRVLTESHPEVVHIEEEPWSQPALLGLRSARRLRVPGVISTAESLARSYTMGERLRRERSLRLAAGIIGTNNLAVALVTKRRPALPRISLPQMGITPPDPTPREPHPGLAIGFLGRLVPERGLDLLFRACVALAGKWTLTVVGTGPSQEELEVLAQRLGIAARISWLGPLTRDAVEEVWRRLDCVVLPSRTTERWVLTIGRAAVQAMAHGVAVVGTDSGSLRELVGNAGRVVPEEDVPALTAALQQLHDDRSECERLGAEGRRRIMEEFTDRALAGKMLTFWRKLTTATA
jgi:glycosyltransferase involved in cell wall biosynthesis